MQMAHALEADHLKLLAMQGDEAEYEAAFWAVWHAFVSIFAIDAMETP